MKKSNLKSESSPLRIKAENIRTEQALKSDLLHSDAEKLKLIHELEVHQIELEMQNEELNLAKEKSEIAAQKYSDLYDFAPFGYFTLDKNGIITELNLYGSQLLGKEKKSLINHHFSNFIAFDFKSIFNEFLDTIFSTKRKEECDIILLNTATSVKYIHLAGHTIAKNETCLLTAIDISNLKKIEKERTDIYRTRKGKKIRRCCFHWFIKKNLKRY